MRILKAENRNNFVINWLVNKYLGKKIIILNFKGMKIKENIV